MDHYCILGHSGICITLCYVLSLGTIPEFKKVGSLLFTNSNTFLTFWYLTRYAYSEEIGEDGDEEAHSLTKWSPDGGDIGLVNTQRKIQNDDDFDDDEEEMEENKRE